MSALLEAARQALEALEVTARQPVGAQTIEAITALRQAIGQAEQDQWVCACGADSYNACKCALKATPQRKPLTDEELNKIYAEHHNQYGECETPGFGYERAIECAHGIGGGE